MSRLTRAGKGALYTAGAIGAIGGALYGAERVAARRIRQRPDPDADEVLAPLALPSRSVASFDGTTINVVDTGSVVGTGTVADRGQGTPIVFVHGVTLSVRTWVRQFHALPARGYRVLAIDQRGHGASVLGDAGHAVGHLGDDLRSVFDELDLRDAILVGHSMGGIAVQSFAIRHPEVACDRVRGIVLLSTLCKTPLGSQSTRARAAIERLIRRTPDTTRLWDSPNLGFLLARVGFGRDAYPSEVELVRQMLHDCSNDTRVSAPRALIGMDLTEGIAKIELPALVVCGTADPITPPFHARQIHALLPNSRLELIEGAGHMIMLERTHEFHGLLDDFASALGVRPS